MTRSELITRIFPFFNWIERINSKSFRPDLEAGLVGAILILPQSIALASLAGMPPEYGIYTSIFPVIFASLWGSSWHTLSGPNTAVCVLLAYSVAPFASVGNEVYIGYVLALTFMVGVIQLSLGLAKLGAILDFISHTVISAIVLAVAFVIILSAASDFLGILSNAYESFPTRVYQLWHDIPRANPYAVIVGSITLISGILSRRYWKRYSLVIAVVIGSLSSWLLNLLYGEGTTQLELVGNLTLALFPLSVPSFELESLYVLKELVASAFAIAFLGLMQTIVISRSIANKSGQTIETNQEIIGQGVSNMVAPFISSFAGSGSFNRSAAHYDAGARTPMAAVYASLILAAMVLLGASLFAYIPSATIAGALILVGYGLIDVNEIRLMLRSRQEAFIFILTLLIALFFGLNAGVFIGLLISLVLYLWYASSPNVMLEEHSARDGRPVSVVIIDGNLFFGSVRHVERALRQLGDPDDQCIILLRTDHLTYLDIPGAALIASEVKRRRESGDDVYIYVARDGIVDVLKAAGCLDIIGSDHLIYRDFDHEMKSLIYPTRGTGFIHNSRTNISDSNKEIDTTQTLIKKLRSTRFLGPLTTAQLTMLVEESEIQSASAGDIISADDEPMLGHLILIEGELEAQRIWSTENGKSKSYTRILNPTLVEDGLAFLGAANQIRVRAITDVRYLLIDAEKIDELIGWGEHFAEDIADDDELKHRMDLIKNVSVFYKVPLENIKEALKRMRTQIVEAGETIITQGDKGECFYILESGLADVIQTDAFTDETACVHKLSAGDAFGEEALVQEGYRNATVTMTTPGQLLVLDKVDFNNLLRDQMVAEIDAEQALELVKNQNAQWIDCRYDMEYEESRIPGAPLMSLGTLRNQTHELDPDTKYIVYCRSGRRSRAAAYLLKERGFDAISLIGGIKHWPYEIDAEPVEL